MSALAARIVRRSVTQSEMMAYQPHKNMPALAALRSRLRLPDSAVSLQELAQLSDASSDLFLSRVEQGKKLATESIERHLSTRYPNMPDDMISHCTGRILVERLPVVARRIGFHQVVGPEFSDNLSEMPLVFTAFLDQKFTAESSKQFVTKLMIPAKINWEQIVNDMNSQNNFVGKMIKFLGEKYECRPTHRVLSETGRQSQDPSFVVGVFAGVQKVGEGFGRNLAVASLNANIDAYLKIVLSQTKFKL